MSDTCGVKGCVSRHHFGPLLYEPPCVADQYVLDTEVGSSKFRDNATAVFDDALALLIKKHADYGPKNISASPGGPLNGLRVRCFDKLARINNLIESGVEPENESLMDSWMDLANYAMIAVLVLRGEWPG